jgi:hypothetical protein
MRAGSPGNCGSCVIVADRDREEFEELFAGRWAGARYECGNWERFYRNKYRTVLKFKS